MKLIPAGDLTSASPVLAVRWCLDRAEVEELKNRNALYPHVLFVTVYEGGSEDRHMAPLDQMLAYLTFRRPGNHSVFAKVVWPSNIHKKPKAALERRVHSRVSNYRYTYQLLNRDNVGFDKEELSSIDLKCLKDTRRMDVVVPKEHFPKESPAWLKQAVNAGFEYPAVDQCQFRRRLLGLVPKLALLGWWVVITTIIRACIALWYGLFGVYGINFGAILHPWRDDVSDVHRHAWSGNTWFHRNKKGGTRSWWIYFFHPLLYLTLFATMTIIKVYYQMSYEEAIVMVAGKIGLIAVVTASAPVRFALDRIDYVGGVLVVCIGLAFFFWNPLFKKKDQAEIEEEFIARMRKHEQTKLLAEQAAEQKREREYSKLSELLACNAHVAPELSALPSERQTVRLRFLDLRAKLCRPFAA